LLLIQELRKQIMPLFPKGVYDPQDLEHAILFRLTTFRPDEITPKVIESVLNEQYSIIKNRLSQVSKKFDLEFLFRGLTGKHTDLNTGNRAVAKRVNGEYFAVNGNHRKKIEFKVVLDKDITSLFSGELHYIHHERRKGLSFGLFFEGDKLPFALETTEPSTLVKEYKQYALLAHGIHPNKAIELTRFYTLPGSPTNIISVIDSLVAEYFRKRGIEALFTCTMPAYSKTKGSTIAGGINRVLLVKDLCHKFLPITIKGEKHYQLVTNSYYADNYNGDGLMSHKSFPLLPTVEVYMPIQKQLSLPPLRTIENKTIYVQRD